MAVFKGTILPRLLPLASHYSAVVEWCEVGEVSDIGLVNKIFGLYITLFSQARQSGPWCGHRGARPRLSPSCLST